MLPKGCLSFAQKLAGQTGQLLQRFARRKSKVGFKTSPVNLVTNADRAAEALILKAIKRKYPSHQILAEESGGAKSNSAFQWIIDPLDGTTNYTHRLPCYSVSIALTYHKRIILGVIYNPNLDELFYATLNGGAYLNRRRIRVSTTASLNRSLLTTGFPYDIRVSPGTIFRDFKRFYLAAQAVRRPGSAALDLCYVACGRFDGFWEQRLHTWDIAAGILILVEAGGKVTDYKGDKFDIYRPARMIASNSRIHRQMIQVLNCCNHK